MEGEGEGEKKEKEGEKRGRPAFSLLGRQIESRCCNNHNSAIFGVDAIFAVAAASESKHNQRRSTSNPSPQVIRVLMSLSVDVIRSYDLAGSQCFDTPTAV